MARRIIIWGTAFIISLYLGSILFLVKNQRVLQYTPGTKYVSLQSIDLPGARLVNMPVDDLINVRGWFVPPRAGMPIIIFFKGNAGSFSEDYPRYQEMSAKGYGVLAFDYRGFPMSPGEITEEGILEDALAAFDWVSQNGAPIVLWGRSLGSAPALYVASLRDAEAVLLESPFTAAVDVAAERYPIFPVNRLLKDQFLSREWIGDVQEPIFVAHGTDDKTISVQHGRDLYALAPNGRELWIVEGGDHGSLWEDGIWEKAQEFFTEALGMNAS